MTLHNPTNALNCKDVIEITEIVRSSISNRRSKIVKYARVFADTLSQPGVNILNNFISRITGDEIYAVQPTHSPVNTTTDVTETVILEQEIDYITAKRDYGENLKEGRAFYCGNKVCIHLLDLLMLLMAACGNYITVNDRKARLEKMKSFAPTKESDTQDCDETAKSFEEFSSKIMATTKEKTDATLFTTGAITNGTTHVNEETNSRLEGGRNAKPGDPSERRSSSFFGRSFEKAKKREQAGVTTRGNTQTTMHSTQQSKTLPKMIGKLAKSDSDDLRYEVLVTNFMRKLELEKEELRKEPNSFKSRIKMLIKENENCKAFLTKESMEKDNLSQKCEQLKRQLQEHKQSTRQQVFKLCSRLERLQHAKITSDKTCLQLSLRQQRLVLYEQQVVLICQRLTDRVRRELEEIQSLFEPVRVRCSTSSGQLQWNDFPADGNGSIMYEVHLHLESYVTTMIEGFRAFLRNRYENEKTQDCHRQESLGYLASIEEVEEADWCVDVTSGDHVESKNFALNQKPDSVHDTASYAILRNAKNNLISSRRQSTNLAREARPKLQRKPDKGGEKSNEIKGIDTFVCQREEVKRQLDEIIPVMDFSSSSTLPGTKTGRSSSFLSFPKADKQHGQPSCFLPFPSKGSTSKRSKKTWAQHQRISKNISFEGKETP